MFRKLTEEEKGERFLKEIQKLCKKWKREIRPVIQIVKESEIERERTNRNSDS